MRGRDQSSGNLFSYVDLEERVPDDHPLRLIREIVNDVLGSLFSEFETLYSHMGRPSIPPEKLLRALLLQAFYSIRSERQLMEQLNFNMLFRWFVGLGLDGWRRSARQLIVAAHEHADRPVPDLDTKDGINAGYDYALDGAGRGEERQAHAERVRDLEARAEEADEALRETDAEAAQGLAERAEEAEAQLKAFAAGLGFTGGQIKEMEKRAALAMERGERQARVDMGRRLEEHCSPIWRTPSSTARRLADAVFDEGPDAAAALVEDLPAIGTVRAQPDFSGTSALVAAIHQAAESVHERPGMPLEREKRRALNAEEELRKTQQALELAQAARDEAQALEDRKKVRELGMPPPDYVTDLHRKAGREPPDLDTEAGQSDAWAFVREVTDAGLAAYQARQAEEAGRKRRAAEEQAKAEETERQRRAEAEPAAQMRREAGAAERRRLDGLRSRWTRERQAREKYAGRRREDMAAVRWTSDERMIETYKRDYNLEAGMIRIVDEKDADKYQTATGEERRWRAEAVAVHDLLYEFAGKLGVNFGEGVAQPAWHINRDLFLNHGRTVAQDENGDRVHVAFPRVAGAPELVYDREQERWDYRHPEAQHSYWMKAEDAAGWEAAARIAHYASVRDALKRSDPVPDKVLADYPDLAPKPQQDKPKTPPAPEKEADKPPASRRRDRDRDEGR